MGARFYETLDLLIFFLTPRFYNCSVPPAVVIRFLRARDYDDRSGLSQGFVGRVSLVLLGFFEIFFFHERRR